MFNRNNKARQLGMNERMLHDMAVLRIAGAR